MEQHNLEYAWIRTEADGQFTLLIKAESCFLDNEIDISLNGSQLVISTEDKQFISSPLPLDLYESLAHRNTMSIFTDNDGNPIFSHNLDPLEQTAKNKKNKP